MADDWSNPPPGCRIVRYPLKMGRAGKSYHLMRFPDSSEKQADVQKFHQPVKMYRDPEAPDETLHINPDRKKDIIRKQIERWIDRKSKPKSRTERKWHLQDGMETVEFTGTEEVGQTANYVFFIREETPEGNVLRVLPVAEWVNFKPKLQYKTMSLEEAEAHMLKKTVYTQKILEKFKPKDDVDAVKEEPKLEAADERFSDDEAEGAPKRKAGGGGRGARGNFIDGLFGEHTEKMTEDAEGAPPRDDEDNEPAERDAEGQDFDFTHVSDDEDDYAKMRNPDDEADDEDAPTGGSDKEAKEKENEQLSEQGKAIRKLLDKQMREEYGLGAASDDEKDGESSGEDELESINKFDYFSQRRPNTVKPQLKKAVPVKKEQPPVSVTPVAGEKRPLPSESPDGPPPSKKIKTEGQTEGGTGGGVPMVSEEEVRKALLLRGKIRVKDLVRMFKAQARDQTQKSHLMQVIIKLSKSTEERGEKYLQLKDEYKYSGPGIPKIPAK